MKPNTPNFAHVEGRVVYEPRTNPTAGGSGVTNLTLEIPTGYKDYTQKIGVVAWHRECQVPDGVNVGDYVIAEGRISIRSYDDKKEQGKKVYVTEIVAESVEAPKHKRAPKPAEPPASDDLPF